MASDIRIEADADAGGVRRRDVLAAIRGVTDLSADSPVGTGAPEAFVATGDNGVTVRVEGHDGEWSADSQQTIVDALAGVEGVDADSIEVASGGHEPTQGATQESVDESLPEFEEVVGDDTDESIATDDSQGVETIDGVGPSYAEILRHAGIETVDDVLDGGADALVEAGLDEGVAENIVESA